MTPAQRDGLACARCGKRAGEMVPLPLVPLPPHAATPPSRLFAHPPCLERRPGQTPREALEGA